MKNYNGKFSFQFIIYYYYLYEIQYEIIKQMFLLLVYVSILNIPLRTFALTIIYKHLNSAEEWNNLVGGVKYHQLAVSSVLSDGNKFVLWLSQSDTKLTKLEKGQILTFQTYPDSCKKQDIGWRDYRQIKNVCKANTKYDKALDFK